MGLNDSFSQVRGQILLMDPLPHINKVFSLISQEEHQRKIGSQLLVNADSNSNMAFAVKNELLLIIEVQIERIIGHFVLIVTILVIL